MPPACKTKLTTAQMCVLRELCGGEKAHWMEGRNSYWFIHVGGPKVTSQIEKLIALGLAEKKVTPINQIYQKITAHATPAGHALIAELGEKYAPRP